MNISTPSALRRSALFVSAVCFCTALSAQSSADATRSASTSGSASASAKPGASERREMMDNAKLSRGDRTFFEKAAKSGMKEVAVSKATQDRLMNPQVKQFARMMVSDHSNANAELMALAKK